MTNLVLTGQEVLMEGDVCVNVYSVRQAGTSFRHFIPFVVVGVIVAFVAVVCMAALLLSRSVHCLLCAHVLCYVCCGCVILSNVIR